MNPARGGYIDCTNDGAGDLAHLGKGGGHVGDGVTVPAIPEDDPFCNDDTATGIDDPNNTYGDIVVFVSSLVSANPFGQTYQNETDYAHDPVDEHFGYPFLDWDWRDPVNTFTAFEGSGDTIVYPATGGWIDHYFGVYTSDDANDNDDTISHPHKN